MKCIVIYFSQTGNTEQMAKAIHAGVKDTAGHCDIVKIKEADPRRLQEYDLIGLGTPVFGYAEPINVRAFIKDMRFVGGKHIFAFATHGTHGEYFPSSIAPKLKRRGLVVIGVRRWYANTYIPGSPDPYPTAGHPDEIDREEAEGFGREMAELSRRIYAGEANLIPPLPKSPKPSLTKMLGALHKKEVERGAPEFGKKEAHRQTPKFDQAKCIYPECQLCMDNCPLDGIDLTVDPPVIAQPCMHCMFCSKICPTAAMDHLFFFETPAEKTSKLVPEFYLEQLAKDEAEGRFRRLVPIDKIGWTTPYYKKHNKHPWWVIGKGLQ
jgi:flavodoxin/formate hydrogenlyase subunit 6/NADH:ubiquinone oxidoreductase subunit I